jgi:drug/metabolite transporter (DMT)-like permease
MAVGALSFSIMAALVKLAGQTLPTMEVVLARSLVTGGLSYVALSRRGIPFLGKEPRLLVARGVLGFFALSCFYYAVVQLPLADATVIQYTNPIFTALIASVALGEALRRGEVVLTVSSLAGVLLVARPSFLFGGSTTSLDPLGVTAALCGAVFSASAYVMVRRLRREEPMVVVFWFGLMSILMSLPFLAHGSTRLPVGWEWLILLGVGLSTHFGQVFLTRGLQLEPAGRATAVGYLQILFAALWGLLIFGERPDAWTGAGAAVIVLCTWLLTRTRAVTPTVAPGGGPPATGPGGPRLVA